LSEINIAVKGTLDLSMANYNNGFNRAF